MVVTMSLKTRMYWRYSPGRSGPGCSTREDQAFPPALGVAVAVRSYPGGFDRVFSVAEKHQGRPATSATHTSGGSDLPQGGHRRLLFGAWRRYAPRYGYGQKPGRRAIDECSLS